MRLSGRFRAYSVDEVGDLLSGLVRQNVRQLREGERPISEALRPDVSGRRRLSYIRRDDDESWWSIRDLWRRGGGDCEDLAAALAAELRVFHGLKAHVHLYRVRAGLWHAVVRVLVNGQWKKMDPSRWGGMGEA